MNLGIWPWYVIKEQDKVSPGEYYYEYSIYFDLTVDPYYIGGKL